MATGSNRLGIAILSATRRLPSTPRPPEIVATRQPSSPPPVAYPALLLGNVALAFGPWLVRMADTGPVAAGFWRLGLAAPILWLLAFISGQPVDWPGGKLAL